ncbi:methyltransferase domain-containing protein [Hirschia litorea]|uniref:Arsenite methyltransferase n=1 Tax=Hirschia litorea TaxID=1199156 RepID=A0ABW2IKE8_9PROT
MKQDQVKDYYGQTLQNSTDLKTDACCTQAAPPLHIRKALGDVHDDVASRYYGCGIVIPSELEGLKILDLGSGAGRDVFALAKLVGPNGSVTGVDMTAEQLDIARKYEPWHAEKFGYESPNTRFLEGYLEKLDELDLEPESFDLIISNCVINLCTDKLAVFRAAHSLLKPGGELYFSDVYADRRVPEHLINDPILYGECLSGALYWNDFISMAKSANFIDPRICEYRPLSILHPQIQDMLAPIKFASVTARLMKLNGMDAACEDYGQAVIYKGGAQGMERIFELDTEHKIEAGRVFPVCRNTLKMLTQTRFSRFFDVLGNGDTHLGPFPGCAPVNVFSVEPSQSVPSQATMTSCC